MLAAKVNRASRRESGFRDGKNDLIIEIPYMLEIYSTFMEPPFTNSSVYCKHHNGKGDDTCRSLIWTFSGTSCVVADETVKTVERLCVGSTKNVRFWVHVSSLFRRLSKLHQVEKMKGNKVIAPLFTPEHR